MQIKRSDLVLRPDCRRVILKSFVISDINRVKKIVRRITTLDKAEVAVQLNIIKTEFSARHPDLIGFFKTRFNQIRPLVEPELKFSEDQRLLIGAYFSHEYAIESAALFNPSIVWHPDQTNLNPGERRFILSLRATGEGHISSITFRTGTFDLSNNIRLDDPGDFIMLPTVREKRTDEDTRKRHNKSARPVNELFFDKRFDLSERVIFPLTESESNGIEDARFVEFRTDDLPLYYATYTAYDGKTIRPRLIETKDFLTFRIYDLEGPAIRNKGLALFPQKINGQYAMLSRQDNENNLIMFSDNLFTWSKTEILQEPVFPWEFIQLGNCGSPLKTEAGWLVLSHGVGAMRKYTIGAFLLDLNDPRKLIGRSSRPLISPNEKEREGYVPNVVYSCGAIIHQEQLIIPYAMSDSACTFASVSLAEILNDLSR